MNNNGMTPQKLGLFIVLLCFSALAGFYLAISEAHGATELQPTARDYQRLNACSMASIRPDIKPETQEKEAIKCAAWGKAVSHIESAKGTSYYAKTRNNHYGIRMWDKYKRPHIKTYKTTEDADVDFARIYFTYYRNLGYKAFSERWTGEPHVVKHYSAFLSKWVPQYIKLYTSITK